MPKITLDEISALQSVTENIRNVCFLAHVDHGKTTLSDHLISHNGIISSQNAGDMRFLDSRPDEQERGITMKASSISLVYLPRKAKLPFLINLIDSPGHVDFSNEVSTAVRLCDGALVLVDVLEGICVQTISVLKQAWSECVRPILVLNKMDRLITELHMSPMEAYSHIFNLIARINALVSTFATGEAFQKIHSNENENDEKSESSKKKKKKKKKSSKNKDKNVIDTSSYTVKLDEESGWLFAPNRGNVIFCSAKHKWGFTTASVARFYQKTRKMNRKILQEKLWGNYYFYKKEIHKKASKKHPFPMFVEFILEPIWSIYRDVFMEFRNDEFKKWIKNLKLSIPKREIDGRKDDETKMIAIMSRWMTISNAVLDAIILQLPSPKEAQKDRLPKIWNIDHLSDGLQIALKECDANYKECVVYIPKMVHVQRRQIEDALMEKKQTSVQRKKYQRGRYKEEQMEKMAEAKKEIDKIVHDLIENVILSVDANASDETTNRIDQNDEIPRNCEEQQKEMNGHEVTIENDENVRDVSAVWQRFLEPEIIYFDDENNENDDDKETVEMTEEDEEIQILNGLFMGVGRIYCGTLSECTKIHVFGPRHHGGDESDHKIISGYKLFHFMGRDIGHIKHIPAGNICGIGGIHDIKGWKTGFVTTASTQVPMVQTISTMSFPVVRVAVQPQKYTQLKRLKLGLKLLNKCDTGVQILVQSNGEYVICASGELHLARCVRDLRDTFAKNIELNVSEPLVSFKESLIKVSKQELSDRKAYISKLDDADYIDTVFGKRFDHTKITKEVIMNNGKSVKFCVEAIALSQKLIDFIEENQDCIQDLLHFIMHSKDDNFEFDQQQIDKHIAFQHRLSKKISSKMNIHSISSFGPRSIGCNVLFIKEESMNEHFSLFHKLAHIVDESDHEQKSNFDFLNVVFQAMVNGFQSVTSKGPLCDEAMYGVGFVVDNIQISDNGNGNDDDYRLITTNIMTSIREGCINSFLSSSPRLVEPMYRVFIQGTTDVLGSIYDVIQKRKGKITGDSIVEGTNLFDIYALLPVIQSFGFCDELRTETAGNVVPQLSFSHFSMINEDPLWIPITQSDIEEHGNIVHKKNNIDYKMDKYDYVKKIIQNVRTRKGLKTDIQTVESAEKQSTRSRKK